MAPLEGKVLTPTLARLGWHQPPFYLLGLASPFCLGTLLAWRLEGRFHLPVLLFGIGAMTLLVLFIEQAAGDLVAETPPHGPPPMPNLRRNPTGTLPVRDRRVGLLLLALALGTLMVLQFVLHTGPYTLPLGLLCCLAPFCYRSPPVHLAERGGGEVCLAACYGWFPVAWSFYLQCGYVHPLLHRMALPIGLSIFNVILISQFRRYHTPPDPGGAHLLKRLGPVRGRLLFALTSILSWLGLCASVAAGLPRKVLFFFLPVLALSALSALLVVRNQYEAPLMLEIVQGLTVAVSLGTLIACLLAFF